LAGDTVAVIDHPFYTDRKRHSEQAEVPFGEHNLEIGEYTLPAAKPLD
jgi:hypothetical protein